MKSEFVTAITQLAAEKGVPREMVMEAIQQALVSAYKQHEEDSRVITAEIDADFASCRIARKDAELELATQVLCPSTFVERSLQASRPREWAISLPSATSCFRSLTPV